MNSRKNVNQPVWNPEVIHDYKQVSKLTFDYLIAFYGMSIPFVAIIAIPMYRQRFIAKWHAAKSRVSPGRPTPHTLSHLRNDHGKRIVIDSKSEAKVYFDQLKSSWN
uniref:Complex I-B15 n=1 Tax=Panagrellus redivivus TaxID=6233 RepID=A0A7E4URP9_PANRE